MEGLFKIWKELPEFGEVLNGIIEGRTAAIHGLDEHSRDFLVGAVRFFTGHPILFVTYSFERSYQAKRDFDTWIGSDHAVLFPPEEVLPFEAVAASQETRSQRARALVTFAVKGSSAVMVAPIAALLRKLPPVEEFRRCCVDLEPGMEMPIEVLASLLVDGGYKTTDLVEAEGQWGRKGGLVDVYPVGRALPVRIEFFGDRIESIREFDPETQRSVRELEEAIGLSPATEFVMPMVGCETGFERIHFDFYDRLVNALEYLPEDTLVVIEEPAKVREAGRSCWNDIAERLKHALLQKTTLPSGLGLYEEPDVLLRDLEAKSLFLSLMPLNPEMVGLDGTLGVSSRPITPFRGQWAFVEKEIKRWRKSGRRIVIFAENERKGAGLAEILKERGIRVSLNGVLKDVPPTQEVQVTVGFLPAGFEISDLNLVVISESEITGRAAKAQSRAFRRSPQALSAYRDLRPNDYVVHAHHGIGRYVGIRTMEIDGALRDYLYIQYAGEDKLYVPVDQIHLVQKYVGTEGHEPRLNRLGGTEWARTKYKVKQSVQEMARELLELYAARKAIPGYAFSRDLPWQREFEEAFVFEETPDQRRATEEIKGDMEKPLPMDRLLCGDVGYGKTEVAMRAAFKSVLDGKQVAVLVPTTILAYQHYSTFKERFGAYPVTIDMLSRFKSPAEQQTIIKQLRDGVLDVVIGTHRLLQEDVAFKDLGLLIIDEEQRFGVAQKEKLKRLRQNVDVLALSATPIPRTLQMSLVGIRDMSLIETPPEERYPVQTYVLEYNENVIREAIRRELGRKGQVYYVHNRVETIDDAFRRLTRIVPEAKIGVAHGQMGDEELERVMIGFLEKDYDVLLCTAIVESGLDIANVNTLIVEDCDRFGLSQLYQLRGRVGRSNRVAYAYFTYRRDKVLSEPAEKRLQAIREFTELGSGFKIALRDLEIRGAGNLLGPEQHGFIASVGFSMYVDLLEQAVSELKSGEPVGRERTTTSVEIPVDAFLPESYISEELQRVEIYKRAAEAKTPKEIRDLEVELRDRFGPLPDPAKRFLKIAELRTVATSLGISSISLRKNDIVVRFSEETDMTAETLMKWARSYEGRLRFRGGKETSVFVHVPGRNTSRQIALLERILASWDALIRDPKDGDE